MIHSFKAYYQICKLKEVLRRGAIQWDVSTQRYESVAEHCFGCMVLAVTLAPEIEMDIDLSKVLTMLTIHELDELFIGDITPLDDTQKSDVKDKIEKILCHLKNHESLLNLLNEYQNNQTLEAKFCHAVDKLECVLEFKKYQDRGLVSLKNLKPNMLKNKRLKNLTEDKNLDLADIFFIYHEDSYKEFGIDEEFWFKKLKKIKI